MTIIKKSILILALCGICGILFAAVPPDAEWFISNGAGMLVESTSKVRALHSRYAISLYPVKLEETPAELRKYYSPPWRIECRVLYERGERIRTQWVFKDLNNVSYLVAAIGNDGSGFIEWYDDKGYVVEEQRIAPDGSGFFVTYTYRDSYLIKTEARIVEASKPKDNGKEKVTEKTEQDKKSEGAQQTVRPPQQQAEWPGGVRPGESRPEDVPSQTKNNTAEADGTIGDSDAVEPEQPGVSGNTAPKPEDSAQAAPAPAKTTGKTASARKKASASRVASQDKSTNAAAVSDNEAKASAAPAAAEPALPSTVNVSGNEAAGEKAAPAPAKVTGNASKEPDPPAIVRSYNAAKNVRNPEGPLEFPEFFIAVSGTEGELLWRDTYRYTRISSLRAIERTNYDSEANEKISRHAFPRFVMDNEEDKEFVVPNNSFTANTAFLRDVYSDTPAKVTYTTDKKQRIVSEVRKDEYDNVIAEITNVWEGDRIVQILWKSKDDERKIEFKYNPRGDRVIERNYRNGILERTVTLDGDREIEELYLDGVVRLRAIWKDSRKLSEERIANRSLH